MKQQSYDNNVKDMSEGVQSSTFTIEVNESTLNMITSDIYNDPILANVREWSTNAHDACIAADKPIRFDVHLPTVAEPYFYVRDYGTGLSHEKVMGLFSVLGASTKRNCNKSNGTLG